MERKFLTKGQAIDVNDTERILVEVPEWGGCLYIRGLSGAEAQEYATNSENAAKKDEIWKGELLWLLSHTLTDENGDLLFPGEEGIKELGKKNNVVLGKLYNLSLRLSILGNEELAELVKNLKAAQEKDSSSACVVI